MTAAAAGQTTALFDSTITTYRLDPERGGLEPLQVTLPPSFTGNNTTAEIAVGRAGRFVYGSSIVFA